MAPGGEEGGGPGPGQVVVVGVEEPGAPPAQACEHQRGGEEQHPAGHVRRHPHHQDTLAVPASGRGGCWMEGFVMVGFVVLGWV